MGHGAAVVRKTNTEILRYAQNDGGYLIDEWPTALIKGWAIVVWVTSVWWC